ncbi:MAG: Uma2 family endonuclease [Chloroflexota bacterium]|nr:Uma2 family endonuclease [Chloroflexota bacterium]
MAMRAHRTDSATLDASMDAPEVDLSTFPTSDGKPVAETYANYIQMTILQLALRQLLRSQGRAPAVIGGNQFLYYNPYNKREHLSPDVYVGFDLAPPSSREVWFTWKEGKAPDIVFEITSPSTQRKDLSREPRGKLTLYAQLGVREYYVYDPQLVMLPPLRAFTLRQGRLEEAPLLPSGGAWSELLRAELRAATTTDWDRPGIYLRVIDPTTDAPIRVGEEVMRDYWAAQERVTTLQQDYRAAREQATAIGEQLTESEQARVAAEQARVAADERARRAEEELERLRSGQAPAGG